MSYTHFCDYCGEEIGSRAPFATVTVEHTNAENLRKRERWCGGYAGHYHQPDCWQKVYDAMTLVHGAGQDLEAIPTLLADTPPAAHREPTEPPRTASITDKSIAAALREAYDPSCPEERRMEIFKQRYEITQAAGGIGELELHPVVGRGLREAGLLTVAEVEAAVKSGVILSVRGIGRKRLGELRSELERYRARTS